jgi:uncharacterized membrane protein YbjE (DUF340 family)
MIDSMLLSIGLIIASLVAGVAVGLIKNKFSEAGKKTISSSMTALVFVLILLMGIKTGINKDVISNLGTFGIQAVLIALAAIAGSIIFAIIFEKLFLGRPSK